ncbi:MAG TPA: 6-carboxytetrahydropterin synthase [Marinagarivorans sp.]
MRLFVDNLTNVDFSYLCPERGLLGETWLAHIELTGSLDEQGMVCDFGIVKKHLRNWLDDELDHRLLVPATYTGCQLQKEADYTHLEFALSESSEPNGFAPNGAITTRAPHQAITAIEASRITAQSVALWCEQQLKDAFGADVAKVSLHFTPETISTPYYHYSHGLKKHAGNCQRIAHGHRSKILIWKDDQLDDTLIKQWANTFQDIYLGSHEDVAAEDEHNWHFKYRAQQGEFELSLPKSQCYMMTTDTTVELIAQHIADTLKQQDPSANYTVKAFEGIGKGAIANR